MLSSPKYMLIAFVLTIAIFSFSNQTIAQSTSWPRSSNLPDLNDGVASHFVGFVQGYAASRGYRISEISQLELSRRLSDQAFRLTTSREAQFEAEAALMLLIDTMINISREPPGFRGDPSSFTVLGESSFFPAISRLCPLWPICE